MFKFLILFVHILIYLDLCLHSLWLWTKQCYPCASSSKGAPAVQLEAQNLIALKKYIEYSVSIGLKMLICKKYIINQLLFRTTLFCETIKIWFETTSFCQLPVGLYHLKNLSTTDTDRFEQEIKAIKSTHNLVKFSSTQMKAVMETIPDEEVLINLMNFFGTQMKVDPWTIMER